MGHAHTLQKTGRNFVKRALVIGAMLLFGSASRAQNPPTSQANEAPWAQELNKYPGLVEEFSRLAEKLQNNIQFPAPREKSRLLPLVPPSTSVYAAFSNYGEVVSQALSAFHQELQESSVLRDWWAHGQLATAGPKVEDFLEKLSQLQQYLGEEIVVSGAMEGREPRFLMVAEIRKPGLKKFLEQMVSQLAGKSKPGLRILDLQELATAPETVPPGGFIVLVRSDFVVGAPDLATLRSFNARLNRTSREFVSTPFGQRVAREYESGLTSVVAADLQTLLNLLPPSAKQNPAFQRSGFADVKYFVSARRKVSGQEISQMEFSFTGPRHGAASWLAKPGPLGSLDFVSPKAIVAATLVLSNPVQVFEDVKDLARLSNPNAFASLPQLEQALQVSVKDDLLDLLRGELTVELDSLTPPQPEWKAALGVKDANHLQHTLSTLLAVAHFQVEQEVEGGVTYYTVHIPSSKTYNEIGYAFLDGYLIVGSNRDAVADAVRLHRTGASLAKSRKLLATLPQGGPIEASGMLYENPTAFAQLSLRQFSPALAASLAQYSAETTPVVVWGYGEETAIREVSTSPAFDAGAVLVVAAIAIPNLLRSRIAANESSAVGSVRTVNTAQVTYAATYPDRGFAPDLASLGQGPRGANNDTPDHAGLLAEPLAEASCTGGAWCTKSGYRFKIKAICIQHQCQEFVVLATPVDTNTGTRSFCSTSDGVIRYKAGEPITSPLTASECRTWSPLQ